jgi:tRNA-binding EMAP/Myf-like protein
MSKGQYVFYKEELYIVEQDTHLKWLLIRNVVNNGLVIAFIEDTRPLTTAEKLLYLKIDSI